MLRRRLTEVDDPARWLGFFSTSVAFGHPVATALAVADEAYINDFPEERVGSSGQKDLSWLTGDRGGSLVKPPLQGLQKRKKITAPKTGRGFIRENPLL